MWYLWVTAVAAEPPVALRQPVGVNRQPVANRLATHCQRTADRYVRRRMLSVPGAFKPALCN
ncbi:hypothetical protein HMPREF9141_0596 [Prevotella multiformis DSM 16608]|uniref:Uncharacterized protein n=1 Tax=Prevotella multiformis DSM 16608 TaxID=888743 RepID=F0F4T0_9BACT|nr:hypothetical protein HMPREF9141_0596 [Prevotella multiformis DSM 16608]